MGSGTQALKSAKKKAVGRKKEGLKEERMKKGRHGGRKTETDRQRAERERRREIGQRREEMERIGERYTDGKATETESVRLKSKKRRSYDAWNGEILRDFAVDRHRNLPPEETSVHCRLSSAHATASRTTERYLSTASMTTSSCHGNRKSRAQLSITAVWSCQRLRLLGRYRNWIGSDSIRGN